MAQAGDKASRQRPLSPHIQIYGWSWTMVMSGFHRATGFALYFGMGIFALWLVMMASGDPVTVGWAYWFMTTPIGLLIAFGFSWGLIHHMLGGIRHFIWDVGRGFDPETRRHMAIYTLIGSITLTIVVWAFALLS